MFQHIPNRVWAERKSSHPWIDNECEECIAKKALAYRSDDFKTAEKKCAEILRQKYLQYRADLKSKIALLPRSSKQWWRLNRELLDRKIGVESVPSLRDGDKLWVTQAVDKANLLATKFQEKSILPEASGQFSPIVSHSMQSGLLVVRTRWARKALKDLDINTATGPDGIPARVLKTCWAPLSVLITLLVRILVTRGEWPVIWALHHVVPIYKKGAPADPGNYRGVHLTCVISKVVEKVVARMVCPYFDNVNVYGASQWAFRPGVSSKDLVSYCLLCWLWALQHGCKVGLLLSDISGAFDRVFTPYLINKLENAGVHASLVQFFSSFLAPREAKVVVNGKSSAPYCIKNQVYQGTVLGPPLWNVFFSDVSSAIQSSWTEAKFADDLNVFRAFDYGDDNGEILRELGVCQQSIHDWGRANRVTFDASKEHTVVLSKTEPFGDTFRFLGPLIDCKLTMAEEVDRIRGKACPKVKAILRTRMFYNIASLISQFKAHALPHIEGSIGAIFHASSTHLNRVDAIQSSFLRELGTSDGDAFLQYNLAPTKLRRNIAALGLLHKINLGKAPKAFQDFFPRAGQKVTRNTRLSTHRHTMQIHDYCDGSQAVQFQQSLFGLVKVYNLLPQMVVEKTTVKAFQTSLTKMARTYCEKGQCFHNLYCPRQMRLEGLDKNGLILI
jgi:hypothetical protein